jgi:hypothetical protein
MVDHMGEPIPSTGFASSQIRRAHQDGVKTPLTDYLEHGFEFCIVAGSYGWFRLGTCGRGFSGSGVVRIWTRAERAARKIGSGGAFSAT